jgi:hypothetical protein
MTFELENNSLLCNRLMEKIVLGIRNIIVLYFGLVTLGIIICFLKYKDEI